MNRSVTWLHLSDLHARLRDDWDSREITDTLVRDLKTLQKEDGVRPDFVFFTGDAAFGTANGEKMMDQYQKARDFLDAVRRAFDPEISLRYLYIVPGNHDVDRAEITVGETEWLRNPRRTLQDILPAMRDNTKQWRTWMERLENYRNFLTSYGLLHLTPTDPHLIWADAHELAGVRIGVVGLNSAWSCADDQDKAKLWCGIDWQVSQVKERMGPVSFSFALIHHPGNWFSGEDPAVMRRLRREFPIVLHGHEHQEWVDVDAEGRLVLSGGACYQCSWMGNGYSIGHINVDSRNGGIQLRQWDSTGRGWVPHDIATKTRNGIWSLSNLQWLATDRESVSAQAHVASSDEPAKDTETSATEHFTRRFCHHVIEQHDVLELFGCDIPRQLQRHQLSVAYVSLNLSPETDEETGIASSTQLQASTTKKTSTLDDEEQSEPEAESSSAGIEYVLDNIVEESGRLLIRGPAGAGKSTLLRWCAIHAAQQLLSGPALLRALGRRENPELIQEWNRFKDANPTGVARSWRWKIPILIRLRECPDGRLPAANDVPRFLAKHLPSPPIDWMTSILEQGRALVLFDGVDEVHRDRRSKLAEEISELIRTYPDCTYVVTTRPGAVERGWLSRLQFTEARVEPMSKPDREEFIDKWYRSAALELKHRPRLGEDLTKTGTRLKAELTDQPELGLLASIPLLCAMICALYRERQERLPETPAELCEALVQMLLHRRERETPGLQDTHFLAAWGALQYPQKKGLLADLASHMVGEGESSIEVRTANEIVANVLASTPGRSKEESSDVLQALVERSGLLRPASDDRIDFLHNTLKEYLAAGRIVEGGDWKTLITRADDPAWQPVILFTIALAPESFSSGLVRRLLEGREKVPRKSGNLSKKERAALAQSNARDFFLVRCRTAAKRLAPDLTASIDTLTGRLFPPAYMQEVEALAQLGPRIFLHGAASLMNPDWWAKLDARTAVRCIRLLRLIGGERAAGVFASVRKLPSYASQLTGEWMLACSEFADAVLPWPFDQRDHVWVEKTRVTDLRPLIGLTTLQHLSAGETRVNDLKPIERLSSLESLHLYRTLVTDLRPLSALASLKILRLEGTSISDLKPLAELHSLESLQIDGTKVSDLSDLSGLASLKNLSFSGTLVNDLHPLADCKSIRSLKLRHTPVTDLGPLSTMLSLEHLDLVRTNVTQLHPLARLISLEVLLLDYTQITSLHDVTGLPSLIRLDLDGTPIGDLDALSELSSLQVLYLQQTKVSNLGPLASLKSLHSLYLGGARKVEDLNPLSGLSTLENLNVAETKVIDLGPLAALSRLRILHLDRTNVTNLSPLAELPLLSQLFLMESKVSKEEVAKFKRARPDVTVSA
jgi:Leucine-rich repeat (LRR) protein